MDVCDYPSGCQPITISSNNSELLKRLKILSDSLKDTDSNEDVGTPGRYRSLLNHLTQAKFLNNSNKDVQILLACCITEIFRIFAPIFYVSVLFYFQNLSVAELLLLTLDSNDDAQFILRELIKADERLRGLFISLCSKFLQNLDRIDNIVLDILFYFLIQPQKKFCLDLIVNRAHDPNEEVRMEVISMVRGLAKSKFDLISERLLMCVVQRIRDTKVKVRHAAIIVLSQLYRLVNANDEFSESERASVFIVFSIDCRMLIEKVFVLNLVPYKMEVTKRVRIMINIFRNLDLRGMRTKCSEILQTLLERCAPLQFDGETVEVLVDLAYQVIQKAANHFDDTVALRREHSVIKLIAVCFFFNKSAISLNLLFLIALTITD
ncbi:unnamed protein product [Dracunculus medinensis]|uniref:Condensin complex subunit 3 n=1 Tax=Dracunculus medinensis TaxID=318479 RepID=A0A0N4UFC1_DRAME|nr:unnamed protein product [Dracunculus medinensis]